MKKILFAFGVLAVSMVCVSCQNGKLSVTPNQVNELEQLGIEDAVCVLENLGQPPLTILATCKLPQSVLQAVTDLTTASAHFVGEGGAITPPASKPVTLSRAQK